MLNWKSFQLDAFEMIALSLLSSCARWDMPTNPTTHTNTGIVVVVVVVVCVAPAPLPFFFLLIAVCKPNGLCSSQWMKCLVTGRKESKIYSEWDINTVYINKWQAIFPRCGAIPFFAALYNIYVLCHAPPLCTSKKKIFITFVYAYIWERKKANNGWNNIPNRMANTTLWAVSINMKYVYNVYGWKYTLLLLCALCANFFSYKNIYIHNNDTYRQHTQNTWYTNSAQLK